MLFLLMHSPYRKNKFALRFGGSRKRVSMKGTAWEPAGDVKLSEP